MSTRLRFPRMGRVRQTFESRRIADVAVEVERRLAGLRLHEQLQPGASVAITVGSRGIANIADITRAIVAYFKAAGAAPFIVPAMGSHGGGTAEGQRAVIEEYGVTEAYVGAEIRSSMETVIVDRTPLGIPVHFDRRAYEADHVVVAGRVKPHTGFVGEIESGLHKMMLIGLGKHEGAKVYHRAIQDHSFPEIVRSVADVVIQKCRVLAGVAVVEDAYDQTALIEAVAPRDFFEREKHLLRLARDWMPRLPFAECDLLIVDEIGKNISGTGMDTNVIGRKYTEHAATDRDDVRCKRIFVRGVSPASHGNGLGIGLAEFTNRRTLEAIDMRTTRINAVTGAHPAAAMLPIAFDRDDEAIEAALQTVGLVEPEHARVIHIADTLHVAEVLVSEACWRDVQQRDDLSIIHEPQPMAFDADGNLAGLSA